MDSAKDVYFATDFSRDEQNIEFGILEVMFHESDEIFHFCSNSNKPFTMVESLAYFDASRHILRSLQTAVVDTMPFTKYLIDGQCKTSYQPKYLTALTVFDDLDAQHHAYNYPLSGYDTNLPYNLGFLIEKNKILPTEYVSSFEEEEISSLFCIPSEGVDHSFQLRDITDLSSWPALNKTELDASQLKALQMALTQEIAVIQGPPGTGKTYIGLKIVEALLENKEIWISSGTRAPILIMCFTNHALDQFLEGIFSVQIWRVEVSANRW